MAAGEEGVEEDGAALPSGQGAGALQICLWAQPHLPTPAYSLSGERAYLLRAPPHHPVWHCQLVGIALLVGASWMLTGWASTPCLPAPTHRRLEGMQVEARLRQEASWLFTAIGEASRVLADAPGRLRHANELARYEQLAKLAASRANISSSRFTSNVNPMFRCCTVWWDVDGFHRLVVVA